MEQVQEVKLNHRDRLILESYKTVLDGFAEYLGSGYEMVLHSLEDFDHSVIKIINGEHTGRKEGAPITDLALNMLQEIQKKNLSSHICYFTKNTKGEPLKSATIVIRGTENKPIGLLCMNLYLNTPMSEFLETLMFKEVVSENFEQESLKENVEENVREKVRLAVERVRNNASVLPSLKNRETIALLEEEGVFRIKDSVAIVAEALEISKNTVYLHLRTIRKEAKSA